MVAVFFYKTDGAVEKPILSLLEKSRANKWRVIIKCGSPAETDALYQQLWHQTGNRFIGVGKAGDEFESEHTVLLSETLTDVNKPDVLVLPGYNSVVPDDVANYARVMVIFDANDTDQLAASRKLWKSFSTRKFPMKLFAQENSSWVLSHSINDA